MVQLRATKCWKLWKVFASELSAHFGLPKQRNLLKGLLVRFIKNYSLFLTRSQIEELIPSTYFLMPLDKYLAIYSMVGSTVALPEEENTPEKRVARIFALMDKVFFTWARQHVLKNWVRVWKISYERPRSFRPWLRFATQVAEPRFLYGKRPIYNDLLEWRWLPDDVRVHGRIEKGPEYNSSTVTLWWAQVQPFPPLRVLN